MTTQRALLGLASLATMVVAYTVVSNSGLLRPEVLPPTQQIAEAFTQLVTGGRPPPAGEEHVHMGHPVSSEHVGTLLQQGVTLQASLAVSVARVLFGLAVGLPLGILL